jgi:hypothetical protein
LIFNYFIIFSTKKERGIHVFEKERAFLELIETPKNPTNTPIALADDEIHLKWPVVFLYPEYGQSDFIESFDETSS